MLGENIKKLRMNKGLSQEELAIKVNVVRQTVSKWEKGLSVPDSEMLIRIAEELDTTVNNLLGAAEENEASELKAIAEKLELVNRQLAERNERSRKIWRALSIVAAVIAARLILIGITMVVNFVSVVSGTTSIIGGADGPTAIAVAGSTGIVGYVIVSVLLVAFAVIGIYKTKRR